MADYIISSSTIDSINLNNESMTVLDGGIANNIRINEKGSMSISSGGNAEILFVNADGKLTVFDGGKASKTKIDGSEEHTGVMMIESGGSADVVMVGAHSELIVSSGGIATEIVWTPGLGHITAQDGATALFFSKYTGVYYADGNSVLSSAWTMTQQTVNAGHEVYVASNGVADRTTVNSDGRFNVIAGGIATNTTTYDGTLIVSSGGVMNSTVVNEGIFEVSSGGIANSTTVRNRGTLNISFGGIANGVTNSEANIYICSGGTLNSVTIDEKGGLYVATGGKLTGHMTFESGAYVYLEHNTIVDFDISALTPGAAVRINDLSLVYGLESVDFTITVSDTQKNGTYTLANEVTSFENTISVVNTDGVQLDTLSVGDTKDIEGTEYSLILTAEGALNLKKGKEEDSPQRPLGADGGWNNTLYTTKTKTLNTEVANADPIYINAGTQEVCPDGMDSIAYEENETLYRNFVGLGDEWDYAKIKLEKGANLSFSLIATDQTKFMICSLTSKTDKKGKTTYTQKTLQTTALKQGKNTGIYYTAQTKQILLEAGEYYIAMQSTNAKKGGNAYYNVEVDQDASMFFDKADNSDDWDDVKTAGPNGAVGDIGQLNADAETVVADEWVGFGDAIDYKRFSLDSAANLSFSVEATDATKFTIYRLNSKTDKKGVTTYSLKSLQTTTLKKPKNADQYSATTNLLLLDAGEYYISMQSTNAKKGGNADYSISLNTNSVFFVNTDDSDNWDDVKTAGSNGAVGDVGSLTVSGSPVLTNWVGYDDAVDYSHFKLDGAATVSFTLEATDATKFTIYKLNSKTDKKGVTTYSLKSLQATTLKKAKNAEPYTAVTKALKLDAGDYYFSMASTNAKKGGNASYTVSLNDAACVGIQAAVSGAQAPSPLASQVVSADLEGWDISTADRGLMQEDPLAGMQSQLETFADASGAAFLQQDESLLSRGTGLLA